MSDSIMVVDDESSVLSALTRSLRNEPYEVLSEPSGEAALERLKTAEVKVVISDERMLNMQGSEFLSIVRKQYPAAVRILLTGHATLDAAMRAVNEGGIYKFLTKPWNDAELKQVIMEAIQKHDAEYEAWKIFSLLKQERSELERLEDDFPGIGRLERDEAGKLVLPDLSDDEIELLRVQCERSFAADSVPDKATERFCSMLKLRLKEDSL